MSPSISSCSAICFRLPRSISASRLSSASFSFWIFLKFCATEAPSLASTPNPNNNLLQYCRQTSSSGEITQFKRLTASSTLMMLISRRELLRSLRLFCLHTIPKRSTVRGSLLRPPFKFVYLSSFLSPSPPFSMAVSISFSASLSQAQCPVCRLQLRKPQGA